MLSTHSPSTPGAAYIRYSSSMQDESFSLEAQLRQIQNRAAAEGVEIVKIYSDAATSAYKNKYRPGITQMLDDARKGAFRILYVHKVDRLARPPAGLARATFLVGPADARVVAKLAPREAGAEMPSGCGCCAPWSRRTRSCRVR